MSQIKPILGRFNEAEGVIGSLVCTHDGIIIESELSERFDREMISALISSVGLALSTTCNELGYEYFSRFYLSATKGNILLANLGKSFFVGLLEKKVDQQKINVAVYQATSELRKHSVIG
jgi:predicted regulator of Ras-like GTPase activity (Roadblock/LC7/MglB family)